MTTYLSAFLTLLFLIGSAVLFFRSARPYPRRIAIAAIYLLASIDLMLLLAIIYSVLFPVGPINDGLFLAYLYENDNTTIDYSVDKLKSVSDDLSSLASDWNAVREDLEQKKEEVAALDEQAKEAAKIIGVSDAQKKEIQTLMQKVFDANESAGTWKAIAMSTIFLFLGLLADDIVQRMKGNTSYKRRRFR